MADLGYIGAAVPVRKVWASGTTLFHVAAIELGDASQWYRVAEINGITDPWVGAATQLLIPAPATSNGGILGA
jgi:hypothetical protein